MRDDVASIAASMRIAAIILVALGALVGVTLTGLYVMLQPLREGIPEPACALVERGVRAHTIKDHPIPGSDSTVPMPHHRLTLDHYDCGGHAVYVRTNP